MEEANKLIEEIERQLIEVRYHLERGSVESAAVKSEFVKRPAVRLHMILNNNPVPNEKQRGGITYKEVDIRLLNAIEIDISKSNNQLVGDEEYLNGVATGKIILRGARGSSDMILELGKDCLKV